MKSLDYQWNLREMMARRGLFSTTKMIPLLNERGVHLSASQVYRLAAERPERLNLQVLVALMDILNCTADDLITPVSIATADDVAAGEAATGTAIDALRNKGFRPKPANIQPAARP
jgi:DNA-binding Xre family transcriptional regulator